MLPNPLVQLTNVTFTYPGADRPVLKDINVTIYEGEFTAIIGGNGSGKSTLCKTFNGLIPQFYVGDFEGEVVLNTMKTSEHTVAQLSRNIGYVYQDFENQLVRPTVIDDVSFVPLNYGLADYRQRGEWALNITGLSALRNEFIWQLSGGQMHLLALAGALAMKPKLLIIDEPIAQLDPNHAKQVYDILKKLNNEFGITIIVIEHHTEFIADYCKEVILMDQGELVWKKDVKEALSQVRELLHRNIFPPQVTQAAYALLEKDSQDSLLPIRMDEAIKHFSTYIQRKVPLPPFRPTCMTENREVIRFNHVSLEYRTLKKERKRVLYEVDTSFYQGDLVALVGNNGAGKSSLLKLIAGIVKPSDGQVVVLGKTTREASPEVLSETVSYIYQSPEEMFIDDSIRKDIEYYLRVRKIPDYELIVDKLLVDFNLVDIQHQDGRLLSGGQQRRASLAIGAAMNPAVILLDEPTANLDVATKQQVIQMLGKLQNHVQTVIVATHDMQLVAEWANRIIVMNSGSIISDGSRYDIFGNEDVMRKAGLVPPQILQLSRKLCLEPPCFTIDEFTSRLDTVEAEGVQLELCKGYA
ncbi:energy-coupling factor ABC transporter ATP-binding protein [Sporosarcina sp. NCCP-2222]|uniref:ABC transporter ATP-binding protein n=1 Tax=Sporosarcina sp. NCCP-2222 TaxID=2935073 RepID=UPI0020849DDA|nr:energy-coupling factor transporter ATPase [Sporosarcina sp. NCCP-2222]GKV55057.1 energy-coupling factor ABC transporter ATP-binding protein [Sporosarcina sp. NCCP-2222]